MDPKTQKQIMIGGAVLVLAGLGYWWYSKKKDAKKPAELPSSPPMGGQLPTLPEPSSTQASTPSGPTGDTAPSDGGGGGLYSVPPSVLLGDTPPAPTRPAFDPSIATAFRPMYSTSSQVPTDFGSLGPA